MSLKFNPTTGQLDISEGISDGDKGDITVSSNGTVWTVDDNSITFAKMQNISTAHLIGRHSTGNGNPQQIGIDGGLELQGANLRRSALTGDVTASAGNNTTTVKANLKTQPITLNISGGGAAISAGLKAEWQCPYNCTIQSWSLLADVSTTCAIDVWKDTFANYPPDVSDTITGSAKPALTASTAATSSTLTGWTTSISAGDVFKFNVDSNNNATRLTLILNVVKV
jgi:hypothetical protein